MAPDLMNLTLLNIAYFMQKPMLKYFNLSLFGNDEKNEYCLYYIFGMENDVAFQTFAKDALRAIGRNRKWRDELKMKIKFHAQMFDIRSDTVEIFFRTQDPINKILNDPVLMEKLYTIFVNRVPWKENFKY